MLALADAIYQKKSKNGAERLIVRTVFYLS
ncbi:hypothetical protein J2T19_003088 [Paenibacillus tundrae]|uniref:Uncharacterized protein n=1 Tax=Paenibacillus tundrae TaxID=528187 RepID=A0ABT9WEE4_9BACL|nr:hypothetical protein [Paenibacillus tundrae]